MILVKNLHVWKAMHDRMKILANRLVKKDKKLKSQAVGFTYGAM